MKSRFMLRLAGTAALLCSLLCGCILAACGGGEKATLTLGTNNGGTLSETSFEVSVGADLSDFLKGKEPTSIKQGLTFAGWYHGEEQIENGATMPAEGLSLTAKYWANYTLKVYTPQEEGGYEETSTTGKAFYGEAFDALSHVEIPEHFTLDESKGTYATGSLSADAVFEVYLAVETFDIRYQANAPDGVSVSGGVFYDEVPFGTKAEAKENPFELPENYRFAGWATTADGAIAYHPGDEIELTGNITLFARWERGLSDIFGGNDLLFVSLEESGVLYLHRTGYEEKLGSFDGETLLFSFETEDGAIVLDGKLNLENNCFFYFRDSMMGRYSDRDGTRAVLEIKEHGAAEYTSADGTRIAGSYGIDLDTGYFEFLSDEDGFLFDLFENLETGEVIFRRQDLGEEGYYYDEKADIVLYLDGLSGLEYHYNEENYEYTVGGEPVLTVYGYYEWNEESNLFMAYTRDYASILKQFTFKVDEETVPAHPDFEIKCAAEMDDGFRGAYTEKWGAVSGTLSLDGYGHGVMDDVEGDYYVITWLYAYEDDNGDMVDDYLLIRFVAESGDITYFRLDTEYGEFELDHTVQKEDVRDDIPYGRYDIEQLYLLNITFNGFLYIFENGATEIWTEYALLNTNEWAYVLYNDLISSVDPLGEGKYVFHGTNNPTTGEPYGNEFVFTVDESTHTAEAVIAETHDTAVVTTIGGTALVVDYTLGEAYLGEGDARVSVDFWCTMGYIDFYTFEYRGAELLYWTEHNERDFHAMQASSMYDVEFPIGDGMEHYSARLFLLDGGTAYLAYELESGMHRFVAKGVYEATDNADEYTFALTDYLSDWEADDFSDYNRFTFKTFAGEEGGTGVFVQKAERLVFENLTTDGYGAYTFTDGDDTTYEGEIVTLIGEEPGLLIYFAYTQNGRTEYIVLSVAPDGDHVVRLTQDAGFWYEMNANRGISADRYLILNGQGKAYFYEVSELENETHIDVGTYVRTGAYANDFLEYAITVDGITTNYLLGTYEYEDTNLPLYQAQIAHRIGEFDVIGGGHVSSKGYPNEIATYIDAEGNSYFGNMYIGSVNTGVYSHSFVNNASGRSVRFWVYENWIATSTEFIFDIAANGKLEARTLPYGDYAAMRNGAADTTYVLRLDGRGSATVMRNGAQADMGVYGYDAETDGYLFVGADRFRFRLSTENVNGETTYIWYLYDDAKFTLYSESDWTMLTLDGFGGAKCVDRYGGLLTGTYDLFADSLGYFEAGGTSAVFSYDSEKGVFSFLDHSAYLAAYYAEDLGSVVFGEAKLSVQGV